MLRNPVNSNGIILQGHSHTDGMSWFAEMEEPAAPQTSRAKIVVVSFCEAMAVTA